MFTSHLLQFCFSLLALSDSAHKHEPVVTDTPVDLDRPDSLVGFFSRLFKADFMPHGHCFFWRSDLVGLHVLSDLMIVVAYYSIPIMLLFFLRKKKGLPYPWMFALFAGFIFWCGTTHIMNIVTLWKPIYRFEGVIKFITGVISITTAILLYPLIPKALALRSPKELENEQKRRRELESFAHIASHDLREPLRTISLFSDLLKRKTGQMDEESKEYLNHILKSSTRLGDLIDDLGIYSRLDYEGLPHESIALQDCLSRARENLLSLIESSKTQLSVSFPTKKMLVYGVASQLDQLFQNLIANAIKFRKKHVPSTIHIHGEERPSEWLITISDNGIGFEPQFKEQIFGVFKRLHTGQDGYPGTGMGLSICRKVVEHHKGKIWADSAPGQGSTFSFTLPKASLRTAPATLTPSPA